uniref:Uncharacterized protein n=1 Tax=Trichuris muris TaxID=70415 RepID=A0A5S6QB44_TRIMR
MLVCVCDCYLFTLFSFTDSKVLDEPYFLIVGTTILTMDTKGVIQKYWINHIFLSLEPQFVFRTDSIVSMYVDYRFRVVFIIIPTPRLVNYARRSTVVFE